MRIDKTDKKEMLDDLRKSKEFCIVTITACKTFLVTNDDVPMKAAIAILAGLDEIMRVVEDYYGTI